MFVFWHISGVKSSDEKRVRAEFARMRRLGFIGVGLEAGWSSMNPAQGKYDFNAGGADLLIKWAAAEGLWVHLLLTPHYMPEWVLSKHGDVRMRDADGNASEGSFMTFSPYSPAVAHQEQFQAKAVAHFSRQPNILAFWLTNEQGFGRKWLDYSNWGLEAWRRWVKAANSDIGYWNARWDTKYAGFADIAIPRPGTEDARWHDWLRFRRVSLNEYWNRLFRSARAARTRFIPIGHKFVLYNALDAFAPQWAFAPSPTRLEMDILGCDAYGSSRGMMAAALAFRKPIVLAETNFTQTADGPLGKGHTMNMLLEQQFHGAFIQTMYAWNTRTEQFPWGVRDSSGALLPGGWGAVDSARLVRDLGLSASSLPGHVAVVVPAGAFSAHGDNADEYQSRVESILDVIAQSPARAHLLFSDDIAPSGYPGSAAATRSKGVPLTGYRTIIITGDAGLDREFLASDQLADWVRAGGVLLCDKLVGGPPEWMGIRQRDSIASPSFSTTTAGGRWSFAGREQKDLTALSLVPRPQAPENLTVLATLDTTREPLAMRMSIGKGTLVYCGAQLWLPGRTTMDAGLVWEALSLSEVYPAAMPPGPSWARLGEGREAALLLTTPSDWSGTVDLPGAIASVKCFAETGNLQDTPGLTAAGRHNLTGELFRGQFCLVETKE